MVLVWYISPHGFGHATRDIEVLNEIGQRRPEVRLIVRTSASRAFLESSLRIPADIQPVESDVGVVQFDSLRIDEDGTARQAAAFYGAFESRVDAEASILREQRADLVVADIPPLAVAAAARAGIPAIALGNFTWDWIYQAYPQFERLAPQAVDTIGAAYAGATCALRLPLHGGFETIRTIIDIPFISRRSGRGREEARQALGLAASEVAVLSSFGGHGLGLDYPALARANRFRLIVTDYEQHEALATSRLLRLSRADLARRGLRYEDLVAAADVVVSKPGYGIVSECIANGSALLYTTRGRFAEQDVFVSQMPDLLRCRPISQEDLVAGRWQQAVEALLAQPRPAVAPATDGGSAAVNEIVKYL